MPEIEQIPQPEPIPQISWEQLRQSFQNIGIKVTKRSMQSYDYVAGISGWKIDSDGNVEFNDGTFRGSLEAGSIYIPNTSNPLFSVDSDGNVTANSLRRKDFHWFTLFESIDGFGKSTAGTGSIVNNSSSVDSITGTTSGNENEVQKVTQNASSNAFSWDKSKSCKFSILIQNDVANHDARIGNGNLQTLTAKHIGFRIINGAVTGTVANGTTESTVSLGFITNNFIYVLEYYHNYNAGTIKFYINSTLVGTITTNIPSGTGSADWLLDWLWKTTTNSAKTMSLSFVDLWQAN